ncbi:MAG: SDR family NAD(P)-dependent oxidoreductase [Albidovulum sp.]|nr:SDR family NAD(P)-dependent oxidoreductase [Albidovulum sp.]MDE0531348.1 SDR family NAD(P)-dependent oxidoreductase [Albidovulum sp.]
MTGAVLVTGAAGGLGYAIAKRLVRDGHSVVIGDIDVEKANESAAEIGVPALRLDISDEESVVKVVGRVACSHGLSGVVNNAGVHKNLSVVGTSSVDWDRIHSVNARGTFLMCREAARHMLKGDGGSIVNIITRVQFGNPFSAAYMSSKSAVHSLTQCLAVEVAKAGIRVNGVGPGHVGPGTGMVRNFEAKAESLGLEWNEFETMVHRSIPLGRWCRPSDVAGAVSFLMSENAEFMTGEFIYVTGGFQAYCEAPEISLLENPYD